MDRGAWQATVHGIEESDMTEWFSLSFSVSKWSLLCPILCNPMDSNQLSSSIHEDSLVKNTGVGCHALLQGIFPTQGLNLGLPHCRQILYKLSHKGSPSQLSSKHFYWFFSYPLLKKKKTGTKPSGFLKSLFFMIFWIFTKFCLLWYLLGHWENSDFLGSLFHTVDIWSWLLGGISTEAVKQPLFSSSRASPHG